jgi:hypothetical protein
MVIGLFHVSEQKRYIKKRYMYLIQNYKSNAKRKQRL